MPRYLTRSPAESAVRTAAAEDAGCQLSSKLRRWHRGFREKVFRKGFSSLSLFLAGKKVVGEFSFKRWFGPGLCFQECRCYHLSGKATETRDFFQAVQALLFLVPH